MKSILKLLVAILFITTTTAKAHDPNLSSVVMIEKEPGQWLIQLNTSLSAFDQEISYVYGEDAYSTPEEFKQLVINHFREQLSLAINNNEIEFGEAFVQLGHASALVFDLIDIPDKILTLDIENKGFKNLHHSKSIFSIIKEGISDEKFTLNSENDFRISLSFDGRQILLSESPDINYRAITFLMIALVLASGVVVVKNWVSKKYLSPSSTYQKVIS